MYYKLRLEKVDYDQNIIQCTEVWVTEEMLNRSNSIDVLKMSAEQLIDKYRSDMHEAQTSQMDVTRRDNRLYDNHHYMMNREQIAMRDKLIDDMMQEQIQISPDLADDL
jgi:hypothetical protein